MRLDKKLMSRANWIRVPERSYIYKPINTSEFQGIVGLLKLLSVKGPSVKTYGITDVTIVDVNYSWLQFAPKDEHWWLTAVIDEKDRIVQYYFDITYQNYLMENGESYFYDLYLDVVLLPNGKLYLLDEDELEEALHKSWITQEDYDIAYQTGKQLMNRLEGNEDQLREFCLKYFNELKEL